MTLPRPKVLATDLDGTLIPLPGQPGNARDLLTLERARRDEKFPLVFVTGRHLELTLDAIREHGLPTPDVLIADVGTSVYEWNDENWQATQSYVDRLDAIATEASFRELREWCSQIDGIRLQEEEKQGRFKTSYYVDQVRLSELAEQVREQLADREDAYSLIESVDPFTNDGLIDIVPAGVSKAFAIDWWRTAAGLAPEDIVFSGDSGNDFAALTAGYRSIVVANADDELKQAVREEHETQGWQGRLHCANRKATSGVLEGCRQFGLIPVTPQLGAIVEKERTTFSVWAPKAESVTLEYSSDGATLTAEMLQTGNGVFTTSVTGAGAGTRYSFQLNDGDSRPDPRSRFQPDGVHGSSQVVAPSTYAWSDSQWRGVDRDDLVIYELHIGTFTEAGTYRAASERFEYLRDLGVAAIELMPVAACPGKWNWGYDGVSLFAPTVNYGTPDELRSFVDAAHRVGLAVILDVVYNHLGPEGNYLSEFGPYFSNAHQTPWGEGLNFDGPGCEQVRDFFVDNALAWIDEFHLDGLRLDAVHAIADDSTRSILADIRRAITAYESVSTRTIHLIAETNLYDAELLAPSDSSVEPYDAIWCDDLMHAVYSLAAPETSHTKRPYQGAADIAECLDRGYLYAGREENRASKGEPPIEREALVIALQNHDVVGNDPHGRRFHQLTSPEAQRAAAALFLLLPSIPLIFMGEEQSCDQPFHFFTDFEDPDLRHAVEQGRALEYPAIANTETLSPNDPQAYHRSKLHLDRPTGQGEPTARWYKQLLRLRHEWRKSGHLSSANLVTKHNPSHGLFSLAYKHADASSHFVVVRLSTDDSILTLPFNGTTTADSECCEHNAEVRHNSIQLSPNQAVIGSGQPDIADVSFG